MGKIKLNLRNMNVTEKIQFARQIETAMTGNPTFPTPDPPLATVATSDPSSTFSKVRKMILMK